MDTADNWDVSLLRFLCCKHMRAYEYTTCVTNALGLSYYSERRSAVEHDPEASDGA